MHVVARGTVAGSTLLLAAFFIATSTDQNPPATDPDADGIVGYSDVCPLTSTGEAVDVSGCSSADLGVTPDLLAMPEDLPIGDTGTSFTFSNVTITIDKNVTLSNISAYDQSVEFSLDAPNTQVNVTVAGVSANTAYYKYVNGYENREDLTSSGSGTLSFPLSIGADAAYVVLKTTPSTSFVGPGSCPGGTDNQETKTCTLTQDVTDQYQVIGPGYTFDCANHVINGGVSVVGTPDVTIKNCEIRNAPGSGINASTSPRLAVLNNRIFNPVFRGMSIDTLDVVKVIGNTVDNTGEIGILLSSVTNPIVESNTVSRNNRTTPTASGSAVQIFRTNNAKVLSNTLTDCVGNCLNITEGPNSVVRSNTITTASSGASRGMVFFGNQDNTVIDQNTVTMPTPIVAGIHLFSIHATSAKIINNIVTGSGLQDPSTTAMALQNVGPIDGTQIVGNTAKNVIRGLLVNARPPVLPATESFIKNTSILDNVFIGNGSSIVIFDESTPTNQRPVVDTTISHNQITNGRHHGITVNGPVGTNLDGNNITNTGWDGIIVLSAEGQTVIKNNIEDRLGASGIVIVSTPGAVVEKNSITAPGQDIAVSNNLGPYGIFFQASPNGQVLDNSVTTNNTQGQGPYFLDSNGMSVERNNVTCFVGSCWVAGLRLERSQGSILASNQITGAKIALSLVNLNTGSIVRDNIIKGETGVQVIGSLSDARVYHNLVDATVTRVSGGGVLTDNVNKVGNLWRLNGQGFICGGDLGAGVDPNSYEDHADRWMSNPPVSVRTVVNNGQPWLLPMAAGSEPYGPGCDKDYAELPQNAKVTMKTATESRTFTATDTVALARVPASFGASYDLNYNIGSATLHVDNGAFRLAGSAGQTASLTSASPVTVSASSGVRLDHASGIATASQLKSTKVEAVRTRSADGTSLVGVGLTLTNNDSTSDLLLRSGSGSGRTFWDIKPSGGSAKLSRPDLSVGNLQTEALAGTVSLTGLTIGTAGASSAEVATIAPGARYLTSEPGNDFQIQLQALPGGDTSDTLAVDTNGDAASDFDVALVPNSQAKLTSTRRLVNTGSTNLTFQSHLDIGGTLSANNEMVMAFDPASQVLSIENPGSSTLVLTLHGAEIVVPPLTSGQLEISLGSWRFQNNYKVTNITFNLNGGVYTTILPGGEVTLTPQTTGTTWTWSLENTDTTSPIQNVEVEFDNDLVMTLTPGQNTYPLYNSASGIADVTNLSTTLDLTVEEPGGAGVSVIIVPLAQGEFGYDLTTTPATLSAENVGLGDLTVTESDEIVVTISDAGSMSGDFSWDGDVLSVTHTGGVDSLEVDDPEGEFDIAVPPSASADFEEHRDITPGEAFFPVFFVESTLFSNPTITALDSQGITLEVTPGAEAGMDYSSSVTPPSTLYVNLGSVGLNASAPNGLGVELPATGSTSSPPIAALIYDDLADTDSTNDVLEAAVSDGELNIVSPDAGEMTVTLPDGASGEFTSNGTNLLRVDNTGSTAMSLAETPNSFELTIPASAAGHFTHDGSGLTVSNTGGVSMALGDNDGSVTAVPAGGQVAFDYDSTNGLVVDNAATSVNLTLTSPVSLIATIPADAAGTFLTSTTTGGGALTVTNTDVSVDFNVVSPNDLTALVTASGSGSSIKHLLIYNTTTSRLTVRSASLDIESPDGLIVNASGTSSDPSSVSLGYDPSGTARNGFASGHVIFLDNNSATQGVGVSSGVLSFFVPAEASVDFVGAGNAVGIGNAGSVDIAMSSTPNGLTATFPGSSGVLLNYDDQGDARPANDTMSPVVLTSTGFAISSPSTLAFEYTLNDLATFSYDVQGDTDVTNDILTVDSDSDFDLVPPNTLTINFPTPGTAVTLGELMYDALSDADSGNDVVTVSNTGVNDLTVIDPDGISVTVASGASGEFSVSSINVYNVGQLDLILSAPNGVTIRIPPGGRVTCDYDPATGVMVCTNNGSQSVFVTEPVQKEIRPGESVLLSADSDNDGVMDVEDQCRDLPGQVGFGGCPAAVQESDDLHVYYYRVDGYACKQGAKQLKNCKLPLQLGPVGDSRGEEVTFAHKKIYRLKDLGYSSFGEIKNYAAVYDGITSGGGTTTSVNERDEVTNTELLGVPGVDTYVACKRVHVFDPPTNATYVTTACKPVNPEDFKNGLATRVIKVLKTVKPTGIQLSPADEKQLTGSLLSIVYPEQAFWEEGINNYVYPYIFTSDSEWTADVCAYAPDGYLVAGVYDEAGNLLTDQKSCAQTFVAGETKVVAFEVIKVSSPKQFTVSTDIDAAVKGGKKQKTRLDTASEIVPPGQLKKEGKVGGEEGTPDEGGGRGGRVKKETVGTTERPGFFCRALGLFCPRD